MLVPWCGDAMTQWQSGDADCLSLRLQKPKRAPSEVRSALPHEAVGAQAQMALRPAETRPHIHPTISSLGQALLSTDQWVRPFSADDRVRKSCRAALQETSPRGVPSLIGAD